MRYDGSPPFHSDFYCMLYGDLFIQEVNIERQQGDTGWHAVATYWYYRYILNLLLEPQSYETIQYIEEISVDEQLLTPYSGFIIPGPGGSCGFQCLSEDTETKIETEREKADDLPVDFCLSAYPNPFNAKTTIRFKLPPENSLQNVTIKIFNSLGQIIRIYENEAILIANEIKTNWDGSDQYGNAVASGIHFVQVKTGQTSTTIKITLLQ